MGKRIVDEAFVAELEQLIEELLQQRETGQGTAGGQSAAEYLDSQQQRLNPLGRLAFSTIKAPLARCLDDMRANPADGGTSLQLARTLLQIYVKTGESLASLRQDILNDVQFRLDTFANSQQQTEVVYGLDTSDPDFPTHAAVLRQLADDQYSRFSMDVARLESRLDDMQEHSASVLSEVRRENTVLRELLSSTLSAVNERAERVLPGTSSTGSQLEPDSRLQLYQSWLQTNSGDCFILDGSTPISSPAEAAAGIVLNGFNSGGFPGILESNISESCRALVIEIHGTETGASNWCRWWLEQQGWRIVQTKTLSASHEEQGLAAVQPDAPVPAVIGGIVDQINAALQRLNNMLFRDGYTVFQAEKE